MAEVKPIKITIEGVEKVLKSFEQIQNEARKLDILKFKDFKTQIDAMKKELESLKKSIESVNNVKNKKGGDTNNDEASTFLGRAKNRIKKEVSEIGDDIDELSSIGEKGISTIKNIFKSLSDDTKSTSDKISDFGNSLADFANSFGLVGVVAGAAISVLTPLISSFFELSEAEKSVSAATKEYTKIVSEQTVIVDNSFKTLKDNTSTYIEKKEAINELKKILPGYLEDLKAEGTSLLKLNELQRISIALVRKLALEKIFAGKIAEQQTRRMEAEIKAEARFAKIKRDRIAEGKTEAEADAIVSKVRLSGGTALYTEYLDVIEETTEAISNLEAAQKSLNDQLVKSLTKEEAAALALLEKNANKAAKKADNKSTKTQKPVVLFADNYQDQLENLKSSLESGLISLEDFDKSVEKLRTTQGQYLASLAKDTDRANKLLKEQADLEESILKRQSELDIQFKKGALQRIRFRKDDETSGFLTGAAYQKALDKVLDIADRSTKGQITAQQTIDEYKALSFYKQSVGLKNLVKEYEKADAQLIQKRNNLNKVQAQIDSESNANYIREKQKTDKDLLELSKKRADIEESQIKRAAQLQIAADDARGKLALSNFEDSTRILKSQFENNRKQIVKENELTYFDVLSANEKFQKDIFTKTSDGFIKINEQSRSDLAASLSASDRTLLEQRLKSAENINAILNATEFQYSNDRKELARKFVEENNIILKQFQTTEIQENLKRNDRTIEDNEYYQKLNLQNLKTYVEEQRKLYKYSTEDEKAVISARLQEQLKLEEDSYKLRLENETKFDQERIDRLKLQVGDNKDGLEEIAKLEADLARRRLLIQRNYIEQVTKINETFYGFIKTNSEDSAKQADDKENERISKIKKTIDTSVKYAQELQKFGNLLFDIVQQNSQNIIDALNEDINLLEQRSTDVLSNIASLEDDLEGKRSGRRDAVLQSLEQQKQLEKDLALQKIKLANQVEQEEIKIRKREKAAAITNAIINGALAITNIFATVPKFDFGVSTYILAGISAATTAAQVALISAQKFAKGGFTGSGTNVDETGHKVAGVVHNDEWVAPKWMVESPKFSGVINQLENARTKGFADGGFTSPNFNSLSNSVNPNNNAKLESMLQNYTNAAIALSNRPIYTSVTEIQNVATTSDRRKNQARL